MYKYIHMYIGTCLCIYVSMWAEEVADARDSHQGLETICVDFPQAPASLASRCRE